MKGVKDFINCNGLFFTFYFNLIKNSYLQLRWMEGIDDGKNRVGADILHMIWNAFKEHGIEFPFPQREVRILNPQSDLNLTK